APAAGRVFFQPGTRERGAVPVRGERHQHGLPRVLGVRDGQLVRYIGDVIQLLAGSGRQAIRARAVVPQPYRGEPHRPAADDQLQVRALRGHARLLNSQSWLYKFEVDYTRVVASRTRVVIAGGGVRG